MNTFYIKQLNDKVTVMHANPNKGLMFTQKEAQGLHSEVYALLARIAELEKIQEQKQQEEQLIRANVDGGSW
jgi:hypothetical protein